MKVCSICCNEKSLDQFGPKGKTKKGTPRFESRCKRCKNELNRQKYELRKDTICERRSELRNENRDEYNAKQREWYHKNRDRLVEQQRKRYHESPELRRKQSERVKLYRAENADWWREYHRQHQAEWARRNPEKIKAYSKVQSLKKQGKLIPPARCEFCNEKKSDLEAHHEDYDHPELVAWLCKKCHDRITNLVRKQTHKVKRKEEANAKTKEKH